MGNLIPFSGRFLTVLTAIACLLGASAGHAQTLVEALDTTNLVWTTGGDAIWFGQTTNTHDGFDAAQSPTLGTNQTSWLETTVIGPGTVRIWAGGRVDVASYGNSPVSPPLFINGSPVPLSGYSSLSPEAQALVIEAMLQESGSPDLDMGSVYGSVNPVTWNESIYDLGAGANVLRWITTNAPNGYSTGPADGIFMDEFRFGPPRPLTIVYQPWASPVYSGSTAQITISAIGTPPFTYQWSKDGTNLVNATNVLLLLESVTTNDAGNYSVIVSNSQGFVTSSNTLLTVLPPTAPFFTSHPAHGTAYSGQYVARYAGVSGSPPFAYQWSKDGTNLANATNVWLELTAVTTNDTGAYAITVSNAEGYATSSNAWLTILPPTAPIITYGPRSISDSYSGGSVSFTTRVKGSPPFAYQWSKDGTNLAHATNTWLWLAAVTTNDTGAYSITVSNAVGFVSSNALLTVLPPSAPFFDYEPSGATVYSGQYASLYFGVNGSPPFTYYWFKDGTNFANTTADWMSFTAVAPNDAGSYFVTVSNAQGSVTSSNVLLTVLPPTAPFFTYEPVSATAYSGGSFQLNASVNGSQPFYYQWRKEGTNLPNASGNSLLFPAVTLADTGNYSLLVSNAWGWTESSNAVVTVVASVVPIITRQPRSLEVATGVNTWLSLAVTGTPAPDVIWNQTDIPPTSPMEPYYSSTPPPGMGMPPLPPTLGGDGFPYGQQYSFNNVTTSNAGIYVAKARNLGGTTNSQEVLLTVLPPIVQVGAWPQGAVDIFVTNGLAYLARGTNGFAILNVSNPAAPLWLGGCDTPGYASAIRVAEGLAFVADGSAVEIFSVTNPAAPVLLGSYPSTNSVYDLVVRSNLIFIANGNGGLVILDASDPAHLTKMASYATNLSPSHICLSGNVAYLTALPQVIFPGSNNWVGGTMIVDITHPETPTEIGRLGTLTQATATDGQSFFTGTTVISLTNLAQPTAIGRCSYYSTWSVLTAINSAQYLGVANSLLYMLADINSATGRALLIFDTSEPSAPIPVGYFAVPGNAQTLWVDGRHVYVAGADMPLQILETPFQSPLAIPQLTLRQQNGFKLQLHGRRGRHYSVNYTDNLIGSPWQPLPTFLLTNDTITLPVSATANARFFRLQQLD